MAKIYDRQNEITYIESIEDRKVKKVGRMVTIKLENLENTLKISTLSIILLTQRLEVK